MGSRRWCSRAFTALAVVLALPSLAVAQTNGTWNVDANGTWSTTSNWLGDTVASGTNAVANFANVNLTAARTITVDGNYTIGSMNIGDTDAAGPALDTYTFSSGTLTLANTTGTPNINVALGGATGQRRINISTILAGTSGLTVTQSGAGAGGFGSVGLKGINTFTGNITIGNGTYASPIFLDIGNNSAAGEAAQLGSGNFAGNIDIQGGNRLRFMSTLNNNLSGTISGGAGTRIDLQAGTGTTTLSAANTFSGAFRVLRTPAAQSILNLGHANALQNGSLELTGSNALQFSTGIGTFHVGSFASGTATANAVLADTSGNAVTLSVGGNNTSTTYAAVLSGVGGLTKVGSGTFTLSGANTYTGTTTISAGRLALSGGDNRLATSAAITITGGVFDLGSAGQSTSGAILFRGGTVQSGTLTSTSSAFDGQAGTVSAVLAGSGIGLTKSTSGTLTLSAANTYTGTTAVNAGVLAMANASALGTGTITFGGGTLQYGSSITTDVSSRIASSSSAIAVDTNSQSVTWANAIGSSNIGGLTKLGSGTLTLSASNAYTGTTTISAGLLSLSGGDNRLATNAPITITGGVLDLGSRGQSTSGAISFQGGTVQSGTLTSTSGAFDGQAGTVSAVLAGSGIGLTKSTSGTLTLTAFNTYNGTTTVNAGTLFLNPGVGAALRGPLTINAGGTVSSGTWSLGYAGTTLVPSITINGGVLDLRAATFNSSPVTMTGGLISGNQAADVYANSNTIGASITTLASATTATISAGLALRLNGNDANQLPFNIAAGSTPSGVDLLVSGPITKSVNSLGGGGIAKSGAGRMRLTAANTYTGTTSVNAGILEIGGGGTTGSLSGSTAITGSAGGTLAFNRTDNYGGTFANQIGGGLGILLSGGTLALSGSNTYSGTTTVAAGTLLVNGNQSGAVGGVTVNSGATLGGSGSIGGAVTVNGFLSPGNSPGVLSVASLVLGESSTSLFEIDGVTRGTQYDGTDVTNLLTYGGSLVIDFGPSITQAFADNTTFNLFSFNSHTAGFASITTANDGSFYGGLTFASTGIGDKWTATKDSQTLEFTHSTGNLVIVPEPGAIALAGIGIAAAAWARRRRCK